jgi:hypothetical protein
MGEDHAPRFNALDHGLYRRFVDHDMIETGQWLRARAERTVVGSCRLCGGHLAPMEGLPAGSSHLEWFEARCLLCHHEYASPSGRVLRRSSRHTEMPPGWWEFRQLALAERN